jgi:glycerol-3-phosphate cytidylyltransferase
MIGIVTGSFDLLHAGHINLLKKAKQKCDYLFVALHVDPSIERSKKNKPIESLLEREIKLRACRYVDEIIIYETEADLSIIFKYFPIGKRFLGSDAKDGRVITDKDAIPIEYIDSLSIHTSEFRKRIKNS